MTDEEIVRDSNGTIIEDLKVKGSNSGLKRGTIIKNINLTPGTAEPIEGSGQFRGFFIKAEYVKKV